MVELTKSWTLFREKIHLNGFPFHIQSGTSVGGSYHRRSPCCSTRLWKCLTFGGRRYPAPRSIHSEFRVFIQLLLLFPWFLSRGHRTQFRRDPWIEPGFTSFSYPYQKLKTETISRYYLRQITLSSDGEIS